MDIITKSPTETVEAATLPKLPASVTFSSGDLTPPKPARADQWAVLAATRFVLAFIVLTGHVYAFGAYTRDWTSAGQWWNEGSAVFAFLVSLVSSILGKYRSF